MKTRSMTIVIAMAALACGAANAQTASDHMDSGHMSAAAMKTMHSCQAMSHDAMMKSHKCQKMMAAHPEMTSGATSH